MDRSSSGTNVQSSVKVTFCKCPKRVCGIRCSCKKAGVPCTAACSCFGQQMQCAHIEDPEANIGEDIEDSDIEDEVDDSDNDDDNV